MQICYTALTEHLDKGSDNNQPTLSKVYQEQRAYLYIYKYLFSVKEKFFLHIIQTYDELLKHGPLTR